MGSEMCIRDSPLAAGEKVDKMSDSENEVEVEMTQEEREQQEAEENAQIWQCFMQYDYE